MKRVKSLESFGARKLRLSYALVVIGSVYLIFVSFKFHHLLEIATVLSGDDSFSGLDRPVHGLNAGNVDRTLPVSVNSDAFHRKLEDSRILPRSHGKELQSQLLMLAPIHPFMHWVGQNSSGQILSNASNLSEFDKLIDEAWVLGLKAWKEAMRYNFNDNLQASEDAKVESCPSSVSKDSADFSSHAEEPIFLPCGLAAGSSITLIGTPHKAHAEYVPQLAKMGQGDGTVWVSQFMVELQGLKVVDGEDPPKILHLNPRIKGDWSKKPIIEHNTCYRMQWGTAMRCDGSSTENEEDTVDGFKRCEKWTRGDNTDAKESKTTWWLHRFIGRAKTPKVTWQFPFVEGSLFVLTIRAGVDGYHIFVGGRHITSFPYRPGFSLEDATGLSIKGDVNMHSLYATNLPVSHPRFSLDQVLEMSDKWRSPLLPQIPIDLFIGILSASNHFAERMAVRKTWMQSFEVKSSNVVARFFVALNPRKEVNAMLKKEAEFFGDIVILPFLDRYELVVLKTIAICEYGVHNVTAAYIMKCDDDNFVRVNIVLRAIRVVNNNRPLYMGNINRLHRPLRTGKWAVTYEEWPENVYPPYANGPGYIISRDIANFVVTQHANHNLRLFKMEDVSMGMWVETFNASTAVQYWHSLKFCQFGCVENYYTAHYQSPRQMLCLWKKLVTGRVQCCNLR